MIDADCYSVEVRTLARTLYGHALAPFDWTGPRNASSECTNPGCNMGATIDLDKPVLQRVSGSAVNFHCPGRASNAL